MADEALKERQNLELASQLARNGLVKRPLAEVTSTRNAGSEEPF